MLLQRAASSPNGMDEERWRASAPQSAHAEPLWPAGHIPSRPIQLALIHNKNSLGDFVTPFQIRKASAGAMIQYFFDGLNGLALPTAAVRPDLRVPDRAKEPETSFCLDIYHLAAEAGVEPFVRPEHSGLLEGPD